MLYCLARHVIESSEHRNTPYSPYKTPEPFPRNTPGTSPEQRLKTGSSQNKKETHQKSVKQILGVISVCLI